MSWQCSRRTFLASLGASTALGLAGCMTWPAQSGRRADGIYAAAVTGPVGARVHDNLTRAAPFGASGTALVAIDDRLVLHQGYGFADLARGTPNTVHTLYDVGSTTKTMTAAAILLLASEGRLSISDPIGRFFADVPSDKQEIRLEHLLTHTAGILDPPRSDYDPVGREELIAIVFASALAGAPGTTYNYSNAGFSILAAIIEKLTETPYERYMRERLFRPAGMTRMGYTLPDWDPELVAHTYTYPVDHGSPLERLRRATGPGWILMGNGGLIGTAADLYRWERFFRSGSVIPAAQVAMATSPHHWLNPRLARGFDWEIEITESGERSYGHASDAPFAGLNGWIGYYPSQKASIAWLANNRLNGASSRHFVVPNLRRIIRGETLALPPVLGPIAPAELRKVEGRYVADHSEIGVRASHSWLEVGANGQDAVDLFNARQGEASVTDARSLTERAALFARALEQQDRPGLAPFFDGPSAADAFLAEWSVALAAHGQLQGATVLGTFRLDRRAYLTTIRFDFAGGPIVARFSWQGGRPVPFAEDQFLATLAGPMSISPVPYAAWQPFWYPKEGGLFTFDLLTGTRRELKSVERDGRVIGLSSERPGGAVGNWARQPASD